MNRLGRTDSRQVTISLIREYHLLRIQAFNGGSDGWRTSVGCLDPIDIQVVICEYGTSHGGDTDCLIFQTHIGYNLGD